MYHPSLEGVKTQLSRAGAGTLFSFRRGPVKWSMESRWRKTTATTKQLNLKVTQASVWKQLNDEVILSLSFPSFSILPPSYHIIIIVTATTKRKKKGRHGSRSIINLA